MKSRNFLVVLFVHLWFVGKSQVNLKVDLLNLAFGFPTTKSIRIASEVQFARDYSIQGGYGISWHQIAPSLNKDLTVMKSDIWQIELRRYFSFYGDKGRYFSLNYFQKNQHYNQLWTTAQTVAGEFTTQEQWLEVSRNERAISLFFGYQSNQSEQKRFLLDAYVGLGVRHRIVENDLSPNTKLINANGWKLLDEKQNRILPNLTVGLNVGIQVFNINRGQYKFR